MGMIINPYRFASLAQVSKAGVFAMNTSTGNQAITGVGFTPSLVLFFPIVETSEPIISAHSFESIGAAISSSERFSMVTTSENGQGTSDTSADLDQTKCIKMLDVGTTTVKYAADLVSMDSDGFTINITTAPGSAFKVGFLALSLTNVKISSYASSASTGNQAVTGIGFAPGLIMTFGVGNASNFQVSAGIGANDRFGVSNYSQNGAGTSVTRGGLARSDKEFQDIKGAASGSDLRSTLVSLDADGFTVNKSIATSMTIVYIAFEGDSYHVESFANQTSTGEFSTTGIGFEPDAGLFFSTRTVGGDGMGFAETSMSMGVIDEDLNQFVVGAQDENGQSTTDSDHWNDESLMYKMYDHAQSVEGSQSFVSWDSDGFTLDQVDADPSAYATGYVVIKKA